MSHQALLDAANSLRPLIESEAEAIEQACTMTQPVVDGLAQAGLFKLMVPSSLGGHEATVDSIIDVCEAISFADGSVGWAFCQNTTVMSYSAYMAKEYAQELADSVAAAGMFAPLGMAEKNDGGYKVSGNYQFGSGSGHAEFMGGAALVMENGEMVMNGEMPDMVSYIVPADKVNLNGNWDVMGLRGTGSFDFEIPEQEVNKGQTFHPFTNESLHGGAFYQLGPINLGTVNSVGWAIGVAARALHEISEIAKNGRARLGVLPLREQQIFQRDLGQHTTALNAARALVKHAYQHAIDGIESGLPDEERKQRLRETKAAANHVARVARDAATFAWQAAGSAGMRNPSTLQRCYRDICVGAGHQVFDDRNYIELVKLQLGLAPDPF